MAWIDNDAVSATIWLMTILLVEDEYKLARAVKKGLEIERYVVDVAYDGEEGLRKGLKNDYDVILLDLMLPKKDGMDVCQQLRKKKIQVPIIVLTARDKIADRIRGLDIGADDYLTKPFDFDELLARIRSVLRRKKTTEPVRLKVDNLVLDPATHEVKRAGKVIPLSHKEYSLLDYLMRHPNKVLTRKQLFEHIWPLGAEAKGNSVDVYIRYLRRKVDEEYDKKLIYTVHGTGYKIKE